MPRISPSFFFGDADSFPRIGPTQCLLQIPVFLFINSPGQEHCWLMSTTISKGWSLRTLLALQALPPGQETPIPNVLLAIWFQVARETATMILDCSTDIEGRQKLTSNYCMEDVRESPNHSQEYKI